MATGGALNTTIPGGKYAVLKFNGTVEQVGEAWAALLPRYSFPAQTSGFRAAQGKARSN